MATLLLESSHRAWDQITEVFGFVWPTATAMWNLRWQVNGYLSVRRDATKPELQGRFAAGSGIPSTDLRNACVTTSWEQQESYFAKYLLTNLFAIYEYWAEDSLAELGHPNAAGLAGQLQMPTVVSANGRKEGIGGAIDSVTAVESPAFKSDVYPELTRHKWYSLPTLDNLLICYRFFKACRNSQMHRGSIANSVDEQAYLRFAPIASPNALA